MPTRYCEIPGCDRELSPRCGSHGGLMICSRCRSVRYYWRSRGHDAFIERRARLRFWNQRVEYLAPYIERLVKRARARVREAARRAA